MLFKPDAARPGVAWPGMARRGEARFGQARRGMVWRGRAWRGKAGRGAARHGFLGPHNGSRTPSASVSRGAWPENVARATFSPKDQFKRWN